MKKKNDACWQKYFLRKKLKIAVLSVIFVGILFICYQMFSMKQLSDEIFDIAQRSNKTLREKSGSEKLSKTETGNEILRNIRGIKLTNSYMYKPNSKNKFICFESKEEIPYNRVNDDYCDCADGSDEPGTNACDGKFYCETQQTVLPSSRVNDGICDCCDGSDEWAQIFPIHRLDEMWQKKLGRYESPCPNLCPADV